MQSYSGVAREEGILSEDEINIMRGLKNLLDPTNLMNPGKVVD